MVLCINHSQPAFTCLKSTIETLEQGVKYVWRRSDVFIVNFEHISLCSRVSIVNFEHVIAGWVLLGISEWQQVVDSITLIQLNILRVLVH